MSGFPFWFPSNWQPSFSSCEARGFQEECKNWAEKGVAFREVQVWLHVPALFIGVLDSGAKTRRGESDLGHMISPNFFMAPGWLGICVCLDWAKDCKASKASGEFSAATDTGRFL